MTQKSGFTGIRQGWPTYPQNQAMQGLLGINGLWIQLLQSVTVNLDDGSTRLGWTWQLAQPTQGGQVDSLAVGDPSWFCCQADVLTSHPGYAVGDVVDILGGSLSTTLPVVSQTVLTVISVNADTTINSVTITNPGQYYIPPDPAKDVNGSIFDLTFYQPGFIPATSGTVTSSPAFELAPPSVAVSVDSIVDPGTNYAVGDTLTLSGGSLTASYQNPTIIYVTQIDAGGGITGIDIIVPGTYLTAPTSPLVQGATSGVGSGASFSVTYSQPGQALTARSGDVVFASPGYRSTPQGDSATDSQGHGLEYFFPPVARPPGGFVKILSLEPDSNGRYLAIEQFRDAATATWSDGAMCLYEEANLFVPILYQYAMVFPTGFAQSDQGNSFAESITSIVDGGAGYAAGDDIILDGGIIATGFTATILIVTEVDGSGAVLAAEIQDQGGYTTPPTNPVGQASTSGNGTGATFDMQYSTPFDYGTLRVYTAAVDVCIVVRLTSTAKVDGYYPAIEQIFDPTGGFFYDGNVCWYKDANDG